MAGSDAPGGTNSGTGAGPGGSADSGADGSEHHSLIAVENLPDLSDNEREAVIGQSRPSAALIHETIRAEGEGELERTTLALLLSGLAAGLSMGFSLVVEGLVRIQLPDAPWRGLVTNFGYTFGFLVVVLGRQQLFTENTVTVILPLLHNRTLATLGQVARLWATVLAANIAGAWAFAAAIAHTEAFGGAAKQAFATMGRHVPMGSFSVVFAKAVFAGWLIALMVWLLPATGSARPLIIILITYAVALSGFGHVIAGSVEVLYLVETGRAGWDAFLGRFFVPTLLGNVAGGVALVAVLNYGQVAPEIRRSQSGGQSGAQSTTRQSGQQAARRPARR